MCEARETYTRSALGYTLAAGSLVGFSYQHLGEPVLIEVEQETTGALQDCIAPTGREARSEALEHVWST